MQPAKTIRIGPVNVDTSSLMGISHVCDPMKCRKGRCCCAAYEVAFTAAEVERITGLIPQCARYAAQLLPGADLENPFEETEDKLYAVETTEEGTCAFGFKDKHQATWCSIHAAVLAAGGDPYALKAQPCVLWPLALSDDQVPVLSVQEDAFSFPCNRHRYPKRHSLHRGIRQCIAGALGKDFLTSLETRLRASKSGVDL